MYDHKTTPQADNRAGLLREAMQKISRNEHQAALDCLEKVGQFDQPMHNFELLRAFSLMGLQRLDEALAAVNLELTNFPSNIDAVNLKAKLTRQPVKEETPVVPVHAPEQPVKALHDWDNPQPQPQSEEMKDLSTIDLIRKAMKNISEKNFTEALRIIDYAKESGESIRNMEMLRAICLMRLERIFEAEAAVVLELAKYPDNADAISLMEQLRQNKISTLEAEKQIQTEAEKVESPVNIPVSNPNPGMVNRSETVSEMLVNAMEQLISGEVHASLRILDRVRLADEKIRGLDYLRGLMFDKIGKTDDAVVALADELLDFPDNHEAGQLMKNLQAHSPAAPVSVQVDERPKLWHEIANQRQELTSSLSELSFPT